LKIDLSRLPTRIHLGTSSFSTADWCGSFYPTDLPPHDFLGHYANVFRTVEIDATWHFMPGARTVDAWARKVPDGFVFAAKVPKSITHEKQLEGCEEEWGRFIETMTRLGLKLGPLLFSSNMSQRKGRPGVRDGEKVLRRSRRSSLLPRRIPFRREVRNEVAETGAD
jgi:uncharacterized protein YecE (DUF72 family)